MPASSPQPSARRDWRALLQLAWPILIAQLAQVGMGVTDTVMAGGVSATDLAAVAVGFSLWMPIVFSFVGVLQATTAMVARAVGAGDEERLAATMRQSVWLALLLSVAGIALLLLAPALLRVMAVAPEVRPIAEVYLTGVAMGLPGALLFQVLRGLSEGSGRSKPIMLISVGGFLINIPLNWFFIHGLTLPGGLTLLPALGGGGCGFATGSVQWLLCAALAWHTAPQWRPRLRRLGPPRWRELGALLWLGGPIGGALFLEVSIFAVVSLLIGPLGAQALASHQIAMSVSATTFMIPSALGAALTVRVGNALGRGEAARARRIAWLGAATGVALALATAATMVLGGEHIVSFYNDDPAVRQLAVYLLMFAAAYQVSDALQVTAAGSLRGYHDTRVTFVLTIVAYWGVGLPVGYITGLTDWWGAPMGVAGFWLGFVAGLSTAGLLLNIRLHLVCHKRSHGP